MMAYVSHLSIQEREAGELCFETSLDYIVNSEWALTTKRDPVNPVPQRKKARKKQKRKW